MVSKHRVVTGVILDEQTELTVSDLCRSCSVRREKIMALVEEGILTPITRKPGDAYTFSGISARRANRALKLQRELELDLSGVAVALELLEEIERLRSTLRLYEETRGQRRG